MLVYNSAMRKLGAGVLCLVGMFGGCGGKDAGTPGQSSGATAGASGLFGDGGSAGTSGGSAGATGGTGGTGATGGTGGYAATGGTGGTGATGGTGGLSGNPSDASVPSCNSITFPSQQVAVATGDSAPAPAGGTISDGTYFVVSITSYGADSNCSEVRGAPETIVISGTTAQINSNEFSIIMPMPNNQATQVGRWSATFSTSGTVLSMQKTCPAVPSGSSEPTFVYYYTAQGTELLLFDESNPDCGTVVTELTEQ